MGRVKDNTIDGIRRRSRTWETGRNRTAEEMASRGLILGDDPSTQPARDRAALLRMMDAEALALDGETEAALLSLLRSKVLLAATYQASREAAATVIALVHLLSPSSRKVLHATALDAASAARDREPLAQLARHLQETT